MFRTTESTPAPSAIPLLGWGLLLGLVLPSTEPGSGFGLHLQYVQGLRKQGPDKLPSMAYHQGAVSM